MNIESMLRVGTKITHSPVQSKHPKFKKTIKFHDVCLIYEDRINKGFYISLSQPTGKVGFGQSPEEAYINLVISLICAIRRGVMTKKEPYFGVESKKRMWEILQSVHRMSYNKQVELLKKASHTLPGCICKDVETSTKGQDSIESTCDELGETYILELSVANVDDADETGSGIMFDDEN